jgi:ubiquinone/menaquinone biosynthesis C-methylase UbiE
MPNIFKETLGDIAGGRVLDVATQEGGFIQILVENLKGYDEIFGVDINEQALETAHKNFDQENIQFILMNAERIGFENECFDTVSISASLHHLANIPPVLTEMKRMLRVGGRFVIAEMHRDGQTETQLTGVLLHQWIAEVDSAVGRFHNRTLAREEFVDYIESLGLSDVEFHDYDDIDSDPMDEEGIKYLEDVIDRHIQRAGGASSYRELKRRGEELRQRLHNVGIHREPVLIGIGKKR